MDAQAVIKDAKRSAGMIGRATQQETQRLIQLNGRYYNAAITSVKRTHNITDGQNAGRTQPPSAEMIRDIIGTYISYTVGFETKGMDTASYDDMIETLVQPVDFIPIMMPYGQQWLTFDAYITKVEDELLSNFGGVRRWGKCTATFTPMRAQITP